MFDSKFLIEGALFQEAKIVKDEPGKAIFRMTLQTADEVNQNNRLYPRRVLESGMNDCVSRMKRRAFLGEMDHPFPIGNEQFDGIRQTTVALEKVSHIIRNYDFRNNHLIGEIETTSTPNGKILLGLLRDKAGVGMSMRGLAELVRKEDYNEVSDPLTIISFDTVSLPSHQAAVVDFNEMKFESNMIMEQCDKICIDGVCFLPDYFDKLIETKMIKFFNKWI